MALQMNKNEIAEILSEIGTLLELKGENPFKVRAYHNGARVLEGLNQGFETLVETDKLDTLKGIGKDLAEKISTLAKTGKLQFYKDLRAEFPESLFDVLQVPGLGPKKVKVLYEKLGIKSLGELEYACKENRLIKLEGFGEKTQKKILKGIAFFKQSSGRFLYAEVIDQAKSMAKKIAGWKEVKRVELAGSLRRKKEVVKDIDIVCSSSKPKTVMKKFIQQKGVQNVIAQGDTKSSIQWENGVQMDLRVVTEQEFPYALHHFTGSKEHNTALRKLAKKKGLKVNEYGIFRGKNLVSCKDERTLFEVLDLAYIPPELREGQNEIILSSKNKLPMLVKENDIKGFFHVHSTYSDGSNTLEEMVQSALIMGMEYVGISDHSQSAFYANGLKERDIDQQHKEIDQLQKKYPKIRLFRGIESDILSDGALDYPEKILKKFDFIIGSVHSAFNMPEDEMTKRCLKALENPYCTMIGHPTGRLLLAREGFKIHLQTLIDHASKLGKVMELNANPRRLDLDWRILSYAKEKAVPISINPDAHSVNGLNDIHFGVCMAQKGGLTAQDVFNTLSVSQMEKALTQTRG